MSITLPRCTPSRGRQAPLRENVALSVAVVGGIGIDEAPDRAMLGRDLGFDAAPGISIARDDNGALD